MPINTFEESWNKILKNQGEIFFTKNQHQFSYTINGTIVHPLHTNRNIPKSDILKAFNRLPINRPSDINTLVQGPSYVWAILNDKRILN